MMQFATVALAILGAAASTSALVARQSNPGNLTSFPDCASSCVATATNVTACQPAGESKCLCNNNDFMISINECFRTKCTDSTDLGQCHSAINIICSPANVTTIFPTTVNATAKTTAGTNSSTPGATALTNSPSTTPPSTAKTPAGTASPSSAAGSNGLNGIIGAAAAAVVAALVL